jgi:hypothetical protein
MEPTHHTDEVQDNGEAVSRSFEIILVKLRLNSHSGHEQSPSSLPTACSVHAMSVWLTLAQDKAKLQP